MDQLKFERLMAESGLKKYREALHEAQEKGQEDRTLYGQAVIAKAIQPFEKKIEEYMRGQLSANGKSDLYAYAGHLPADTLALFTLSTVVACNTRNDSVTVMAARLGARVEKEVRWDFQKVDNESYHFGIMRQAFKMSKAQPGYKVAKYLTSRDVSVLPKWDKKIVFAVGLSLIQLLGQSDIGFEVYNFIKGKRQTKHVRITPKGRPIAVTALGGVLESDDLWPMIEEPRDWTARDVGGYHSGHVGPFTFVRAEMREGDFEACPRVVETVNRIQRRAWRLDTKVAKVFQWAYEHQFKWLLPEDTIGCETVVANHKAVVDKLRGRKFWIPHNLCWRGRVMAMPSFSFQGPDYCRGLMKFHKGVRIGAMGHKWISLHMANSYGDDKISKEERHVWAEKHLDLVRRVATDPVRNFDDWREVDAPWQFLAACLEYQRWIDGGRSPKFISRLPIGMDGSSNAIQHGSAFLRDAVGAAWVNMVPKRGIDPPSDLYRKVSDAVNGELNRRTSGGDTLAIQWLHVGVTRKTVKRVVMTRGYAGSKFGASDMILEDIIRKLEKKPDWNDRQAAVYLGQLAHEKSMEILKGLAGTMEFLQSTIDKKMVQFTMPTGFVFRQDYRTKRSMRIDLASLPTENGSGRTTIRLNTPTSDTDTRKMKAGIAANFTHACDAAHLVMVVEDFGNHIGLVHDSYSTVPGLCEDLYHAVRDQFVKLHELDMLKVYRDQVAPEKELPTYGDYDVNQIKEAPYAFL